MGATAAHRVPERIADGTCTQVWAWMTNKCRRRMNGGGRYVYHQRSPREKEEEKEERQALGKREELGVHILGRGVLSPWDVGSYDSAFLAPI